MFNKQIKNNRGMTLVEIMIALLIFSLVMIVSFDFFGGGIKNYGVAQNQAENLKDSILILQFFEKDIHEALEVIDYSDSSTHTNIQLRRKTGLVDSATDEYILWTYYKTGYDENNQKFPIALCRDTFNEAQPSEVKAKHIRLKGIDLARSGNRVGLVASAKDQFGKVVKTHIYAYNIYYDPGYMDKDFISYSDKENMASKARYKNVDSPTAGFNDKNDIVSFEITFLTNDDRNNLHIFHAISYVRALFYQKIYDQ
jgi:prepilin-type N-terminal cleavage/methylation domain-containing protein